MLIAIELLRRNTDDYSRRIQYPLLAFVFVNGTHAASYMPKVYAASDVSGGVPNTHYWMLLLVILIDVIIVEDVILSFSRRILVNFSKKEENRKKEKLFLSIISVLSVFVVYAYIVYGPLKTTNDYCNAYISSGKMLEYEKVWWDAYEIFIDSSIEDAVVPDYHDDVYPVCHMQLQSDSSCGHNVNRARYF